MKTCVLILFAFCLNFQLNLLAQNTPDVNLHFDHKLVNCPTQPKIATSFSLSSADGMIWEVGFIMLTLAVDETVLGTPPQITNVPPGWNTDVYKQGSQWQIELVEPNGGHIAVGADTIESFVLNWPYIQEGVVYSITIDDADLGVNNSMEDEQLHYPDGLFITGSDDCASQTGEIDFYWFNPTLANCPDSTTVSTAIQLASHIAGESWSNNFIQVIIEQDDNILSQPRATNLLPGWTADVYPMYTNIWTIEISSPTQDTITDIPKRVFDIEWDVLQESVPYSVSMYAIDLGLNVPNEIVHLANGNSISGTATCPCSIEIKNVSAFCNRPCESLGTVFFDVEVYNLPAGIIELFWDSTSKTITHAGGDVIYLDEEFSVKFSPTSNQIIARLQGSPCGDTIQFSSPICGPCNIKINNVLPTPCEPATNTYDILIDVTTEALCNGTVNVEFDLGMPTQVTLINGMVIFNGLPADGATHTITIYDSEIQGACADVTSYLAPASCQMSSNHTVALADQTVQIFPNPMNVGQQLSIESEEIIERVIIYSADGQEVYKGTQQAGIKVVKTVGWHTGIYFLNISTQKGSLTKKLVIYN